MRRRSRKRWSVLRPAFASVGALLVLFLLASISRTDPPVRSAPADLKLSVQPNVPALDDLRRLRKKQLIVPVAGITRDHLVSSFKDRRGEARLHEALDIIAPRHTPVVAVEDGKIAKLFVSKAGGNTIYQFDPSERYAYYYAHLDRYADGLEEKDKVKQGETIGYVGTTGNAPPNTPHLHFAIFRLTDEKRWWVGTAIDPFEVLKD